MKFIIRYCDTWNYLPNAQSARDEILKYKPNVDVELVVGESGQFDIELEHTVNTDMVFSKEVSGRFPEADEMEQLIVKVELKALNYQGPK